MQVLFISIPFVMSTKRFFSPLVMSTKRKRVETSLECALGRKRLRRRDPSTPLGMTDKMKSARDDKGGMDERT